MLKTKKNNSNVSRVVIFISVFVVILLLVYLAVGRPVLKFSENVKSEFEKKQDKLQEAQELVRSLPNPQKALEEIQGKLQDFQDLVVNKKQIPRLMQLLGQTAGEQNITVVSLRPREDIKTENNGLPEGFNKIYLEIVVICNYQMLAEYIKQLGSLPQSFNVESLTVEKESDTLALLESKGVSKNQSATSGFLKAVLLLSTISG